MILFCHKITGFLFFFIILDVSLFGKIIRTHALTRIGCKRRHTKIHELTCMRMAEAMRREDTFLYIIIANQITGRTVGNKKSAKGLHS